MNMQAHLDWVRSLANRRERTMECAINDFLSNGWSNIVETGCFRGNTADGCSTLILAKTASIVGGTFVSIDISKDHLEMARKFLAERDREVLKSTQFILSDSIVALSGLKGPIDLLYLDSLDFEEGNPIQSQVHQLAEMGSVYAKMSTGGGVLLDDFDLPHQGKCGLTPRFLEQRGARLIEKDYQLYYRL